MNFGSENSFTLLELLIVIGIVAVLATAVVVILNPAQLLAQARDTTRISDLSIINKSLALYQTDGNTSFGTSSTVYVSIPDSSATCANLGLPSLPSGWSYACFSTSTFRKVNGAGWIPVNFTSISYGSTLEILPIDPVNTTSTGNYYTYTPGGSWHLTSFLESERRKMGGGSDKSSTDSGSLPELYETGTNLTLLPVSRDSFLVGWWRFDEGSGTAAYDASGKGNNGALTNGPTWTTGKISGALSFDGVNDYINLGDIALLQFERTNNFSGSFWIKTGNLIESSIFSKMNNANGYDLGLFYQGGLHVFLSNTWNTNALRAIASFSYSISDNNWHHIITTYNGSSLNTGVKVYLDGILVTMNISGENSLFSSILQSGISATIGSRSGGINSFGGFIDDVRIYNRTLSAAEIAAIYNSAK